MILTIRTDKPEAEVGVYGSEGQLSYVIWPAHRELANTILSVIRDQLAAQKSEFKDITGVVVYKGPGSFTGLRIGITVANTLAYGLNVPIVGEAKEHLWLERGLKALKDGRNDKLVLPEYGAEANITMPKR
ncbi:MAG TPA: tRNA (adenosine(37)-N6)-threonylcarbamoyltransferase complex dimerization subunit type 1 TsaB [Patescibacteria group bacterium]|jgi:tRNA threonylcarbamoyladenosine biosynthesis protein TsaB|nr:tRNA (adenosine(37)-N6)-threonylcarbamoyltransferase complex dimerization subunit type 1 TsaB [Patescibacteria group bacterium]